MSTPDQSNDTSESQRQAWIYKMTMLQHPDKPKTIVTIAKKQTNADVTKLFNSRWAELIAPDVVSFSFPEGAKLRSDMQAELSALGQPCTSCQTGSVLRKYQKKLFDLVTAEVNAVPSPPSQ